MRPFLLLSLAPLVLSLGAMGCIKKTLTDGQIEGTRQGAVSTDTVNDYEFAHTATHAGIAQFEGMHALAPDNMNGLFLLTRTWAAYSFAFIEDQLSVAKDAGDDEAADYQRKRARTAYDRAIFYGLQMLGQKAKGFGEARKN